MDFALAIPVHVRSYTSMVTLLNRLCAGQGRRRRQLLPEGLNVAHDIWTGVLRSGDDAGCRTSL